MRTAEARSVSYEKSAKQSSSDDSIKYLRKYKNFSCKNRIRMLKWHMRHIADI
jgi:hypothetical protein